MFFFGNTILDPKVRIYVLPSINFTYCYCFVKKKLLDRVLLSFLGWFSGFTNWYAGSKTALKMIPTLFTDLFTDVWHLNLLSSFSLPLLTLHLLCIQHLQKLQRMELLHTLFPQMAQVNFYSAANKGWSMVNYRQSSAFEHPYLSGNDHCDCCGFSKKYFF